jgi:hypothetical protein
LESNRNLVEGYEKAHAVGSLADVKGVINTFMAKWNELDCETLVKENPLPVVHLPNMADLTAEVTERVTAKINAQIEANRAKEA